MDVTGIEPATLCLQSVSQIGAIERDGELLSFVSLTLRGFDCWFGFLLSEMVCDLAVHQIVHQVFQQVRMPSGLPSPANTLRCGENRPAGFPLRLRGMLRSVLRGTRSPGRNIRGRTVY